MSQHGSKGKASIHPAKRAAVRVGILGAGPVIVYYLDLGWAPILFCSTIALLWSILEVSLVYSVKLCRGFKKVPFPLRLLSAIVLGVQACFFLPAADVVKDDAGDSNNQQGDSSNQHAVAESPWPALREPPSADSIRTLSVVLPCATETGFVLKTVQSVFEATPSEELKEIIVIDDASHPPVVQDIGGLEKLEPFRARIIRHEVAEGLIRSKKEGGDVAQGDIIVFLDCHVKPIEGWTKSIISNMKENPKRAVVPLISSLDPDTWTESSPYGGNKMCMTWRADFFWCDQYPGPEIPIMSGGLLALTKYWWDETGGLDEEMHAWGGENLDQSLRTWLCGGEIHVAKGSRVAHMWRDASKPKTRLHYSIPTEHVRRNRMRAARAWMDGWAEKLLTFPEFEDFREGGKLHVGSLGKFEEERSKLKCKSFDWYIDKFKPYYLDTGALPPFVFNLKEAKSGLCIHHEFTGGKSSGFSMLPCGRNSELQRFHASNAWSGGGGCCSGIKVWDWDACLSSGGDSVHTSSCQLFGGNSMQYFSVDDDGLLAVGRQRHGRSERCLVADSSDAGSRPAGQIEMAPCADSKPGQNFVKFDEQADGSFELHDGDMCLTFARDGEKHLESASCSSVDASARRWTHEEGRLKNREAQMCVDAADGVRPILYHCYAAGTNSKQQYNLGSTGLIESPRTWADNGRMFFPSKCLDSQPKEKTKLKIISCEEAKRDGHTWEKLWSIKPLETELYERIKGKRGFLGKREYS